VAFLENQQGLAALVLEVIARHCSWWKLKGNCLSIVLENSDTIELQDIDCISIMSPPGFFVVSWGFRFYDQIAL